MELGLKLELEELKLPPLAQAVRQVDHKHLQLGRKYSCSGICLILCGTKNPQKTSARSKKVALNGKLSVLTIFS
ncbi:hypothetical protein HGM15179_002932 [Zosterops borbonicus]|uniref:Uncharacterized protein n=1 Tax=Zosterops borbonicus TaxID=364589 RepID=A0A8K1GS31_9PASS|nr:hypothetical protein HGM15179_002932 [Zosterops borbonicus]